ncbi:hypothetical protein ACNKHM_09445 [Shigella sonnei]
MKSVHILTNACYNLLEKCINGITANKEVCEGYVSTLSVSLCPTRLPSVTTTTVTSW